MQCWGDERCGDGMLRMCVDGMHRICSDGMHYMCGDDMLGEAMIALKSTMLICFSRGLLRYRSICGIHVVICFTSLSSVTSAIKDLMAGITQLAHSCLFVINHCTQIHIRDPISSVPCPHSHQSTTMVPCLKNPGHNPSFILNSFAELIPLSMSPQKSFTPSVIQPHAFIQYYWRWYI